jgi:hypothetical protein
MEEDPKIAPLPNPQGLWVPRTTAGSNRLVGGGISGRYWKCDGNRIAPTSSELPEGSVPFKTYSFYYDQVFWVSDSDATRPTVAANAWRRLCFDHCDDDFSSGLTIAGEHSTLRTQRGNQTWPRVLLPNIYHASPTSFTRDSYTQYGGLTGELPILLALLAFSTSKTHAASAINYCFAEGEFRVHNFPNGCEWNCICSPIMIIILILAGRGCQARIGCPRLDVSNQISNRRSARTRRIRRRPLRELLQLTKVVNNLRSEHHTSTDDIHVSHGHPQYVTFWA